MIEVRGSGAGPTTRSPSTPSDRVPTRRFTTISQPPPGWFEGSGRSMADMDDDPTTPPDPEADRLLRRPRHDPGPDPWLGPPRGEPPALPAPRLRSGDLPAWSTPPTLPPPRPRRRRRRLPAPVRRLPADLAA